jgi:glutathione S-transferase
MDNVMRIYGDLRSGNCLKVKYTADYIGLPYTWVDTDITLGESRSPEFLEINPHGQVPVVAWDDGKTLAQSNAIIRFLARGSSLLPDDAYQRAKVDEWLFWEQYSHEPYIAVCRFHMLYMNQSKESRENWRVTRGERALDELERRLSGRSWLVGKRFSIADIALLAYTRVANEGGFDLSDRPNVRRWIVDCERELSINSEQPNSG